MLNLSFICPLQFPSPLFLFSCEPSPFISKVILWCFICPIWSNDLKYVLISAYSLYWFGKKYLLHLFAYMAVDLCAKRWDLYPLSLSFFKVLVLIMNYLCRNYMSKFGFEPLASGTLEFTKKILVCLEFYVMRYFRMSIIIPYCILRCQFPRLNRPFQVL